MPLAQATTFKTQTAAGIDALASGLQTSAGAASAGAIVALGGAGKLDPSLLPAGLGADAQSIVTSEALAAGAFVNIYNASGTETARNADSTAANAGKVAMGYVLAATTSGQMATVYFSGLNTAVTGQTPGPVFLGAAGAASSSPPSTSGYTSQPVGDAISATSIHFSRGSPTIV